MPQQLLDPLIAVALQSAIIREPLIVSPDLMVMQAIAEMSQTGASVALVVENEALVGIFTAQDVVCLTARHHDFTNLVMPEVMSAPVISLHELAFTDLASAINLLEQYQIHHLPLLGDRDQVVGLITHESLLKASGSIYLLQFQRFQKDIIQLETETINQTTALQLRMDQERLVAEIALSIRQSLRLQDILETTVTEVRKFLNADRVVIYKFQPHFNGTIIAESVLPPWQATLGSQIEDKCFQENFPLDYQLGKKRAIADIYNAGLSPCHIQLLERFEVKANLVAPIIVMGEVWGLLIAHQCSGTRQWQSLELELLDHLVIQIAIAVQQAHIYQEAQTEIAERQRTEMELRASQQRFNSLANNAPVGIFCTDNLGNCSYVSDRWCQIAGLTATAAAGWGWINGIYQGDRQLVSNEWEASVQQNRPFLLEYRFQNQAGQITWVYGQAVAEYNEAGKIISYVGTITDITDRKEAEAEELKAIQMRQELKLLEDMLDIILAGYWDADLVNNQQYISPGFKKMFGYEDHELPNSPETWKQLVLPEDLPKALDSFAKHVSSYGVIPYYNELRYRHRNGSIVWVICTGRVIDWDLAGKPLRLIGCHIDITKLKQVEEQLIKSDAHLRTAQRIGKLGSWEFDLRTQQITWSDQVFQIFGRDRDLGTPSFEELQQQIHSDDRAHHQEVVQTAIATGQPYEIEYRLYASDLIRHIQARGEPIIDASGQIIQLVGTILDITDLKMVEAKLINLSDRLTLAVKSGAIGIWDLDIPHNILTWDERMYELYGITPDQFSSTYDGWASRVHPDDLAMAETAIQQTLAGEKDFDQEFRVVHNDGIRFIKAYALVQRNAEGENQHMIGINFDITDRKQAEIKLLQTTAQLTTSNRELEAFAYSVSHDLRSPLRAIDGFSKALLEDYGHQFDSQAQDYFDRIRRNIQRMSMLIDDLLSLSRVSRIEMQYTSVNLSTLAQEQVHELQALNPERHVTIVIVPGVIVAADVTLMRVVLSNLLQNAWKFTSHHPTALIEFGVMTLNGEPTYFVRDDGAGFDMAYSNMLFGVFQRLHNTNEFSGTGIGLATVQRAIHRHGGLVWAEGMVEQGATIYFTVPTHGT